MTETTELFQSWAIVEVLGHRTRPGFVQEVEIAGGKMLRVDIPTPDGEVTEFYSSASIYSLRPCSEQIARDAANEKYGVLRKPVRPIDYRDEPEPSNHAIENLMDDEPDDRLMDFENEHGDFY